MLQRKWNVLLYKNQHSLILSASKCSISITMDFLHMEQDCGTWSLSGIKQDGSRGCVKVLAQEAQQTLAAGLYFADQGHAHMAFLMFLP